MKHLLTLLQLLPLLVASQNISVKSFNILQEDLDARVNYPVQDQNGDKCALIKMVTSEKGFQFEGDMNGISKTEYKTGEYWLYVPYGSKALTIKHEKLGVLRNWNYTLPIKEATVYEMVLRKNNDTDKNIEVFQWLVVTSNPTNANVYINNDFKGTTPFQQEFPVDNYNYRIEYSNYSTEAGHIDLGSEEGKKIMHFDLKKDYGTIKLSSGPESTADVYLDGLKLDLQTPCDILKVKSGYHKVTVQKNLYKPTSKEILVKAEEVTEEKIEMIPNFGTIKINVKDSAEIIIDGIKKGIGFRSGKLIAGYHTIEARIDGYKSHKVKIEIIESETKEISLHPQIKYGNLKVVSNPFNAKIMLDGKEYGYTPLTIDSILIGIHKLELSKINYKINASEIEIIEDEILDYKVDLEKGIPVNFSSTPLNASLFINNTEYGKTPCTVYLDTGMHEIIYSKNNFRDAQRKINVTLDTINNNFSAPLVGNVVEVSINTNPNEAKVWINNQLRGKTNLNFRIKAGIYNLKIEKRGYTSIEQKIEFGKNKLLNYELLKN